MLVRPPSITYKVRWLSTQARVRKTLYGGGNPSLTSKRLCGVAVTLQSLKLIVTGSNPVRATNLICMVVKVYYESSDGNDLFGGYEFVSIFKLMWWIFKGRIKPKEKSTIYHIRKIETITGKRI